MQYNPGDGSGVVDEVLTICDADLTSYQIADITRRANIALGEIAGDLMQADGTFQFDDSNYTDFPIGLADLVANQQDYTFDVTHLVIERIEVKDIQGFWHLMDPIDKRNIKVALSQYQNQAGLPQEYDKTGNSAILYPAPSSSYVSTTAGNKSLQVYFKRNVKIILTSDTTLVVGYNEQYHQLLAYKIALPYCATYKQDRVAWVNSEITRLTKSLLRAYSTRERDVSSKITVKETRPR